MKEYPLLNCQTCGANRGCNVKIGSEECRKRLYVAAKREVDIKLMTKVYTGERWSD
jgi:hypothetical protein